MTEKEKLISHIFDLKEKTAMDSVVTTSNFLSLDEVSFVMTNEKRSNSKYVTTFYLGGYDEAERKIAVFVPEFYQIKDNELVEFLNQEKKNPIVLLYAKKDAFSKLNHRDYLGALMGLGLKREMIGDIITDENGCYIFCLESVSEYIAENLKQAGRGQLAVTFADPNSFSPETMNTETDFVSVASLRLDCLVAAIFHLSRNTANEAINQGVIYVNGEQILKSNYILKPYDKLVLRGKGKAVIEEIVGTSKKGRLHIKIRRYL